MSVATTGIDVAELRTMLEAGQPVTVLDVRTADDRAEWAIPGSVHVDAYEALKAGDVNALAGVELSSNAPVVTVCGAGKTSQIAAAQLRARGFAARSLAGGMKAWSLAWNSAAIRCPRSDTEIVQARRTGKGCLSYLVAAQGEAAVIDPALDAEVYLGLAERNGWVITHVVETHIHADHLTRSRQLSALTGATLHLPVQNRVAFPFAPLHDEDRLAVGNATLRVLATPGHTPESSCFLLDDGALFTGDTLFLTGVGRPDLAAGPDEARARGRLLYRSLQRLMMLPPRTIVLPGHTSKPVAFDVKPLHATLAEIREQIGMLRLDERHLVETILARIPPPPPHHHRIVEMNEAGVFPAGDPTDLEAGANRCAVS